MTKQIFHSEYLHKIHHSGSLCVVAEDLIAAGWLIEAGYARAEDDYEGPRITLTKAGEHLAQKRERNDGRGALKGHL